MMSLGGESDGKPSKTRAMIPTLGFLPSGVWPEERRSRRAAMTPPILAAPRAANSSEFRLFLDRVYMRPSIQLLASRKHLPSQQGKAEYDEPDRRDRQADAPEGG